MIETYMPSGAEKLKGAWAAVCELLDEQGEPDLSSTMHIIPLRDIKFHQISKECWCSPKIDRVRPDMWLHNMAQ